MNKLITRRFFGIAAIAASLVVGSLPATASQVLFKNGYAEFIADPESIDEIRLLPGFKTLLLFPSDEKIVRVEVGIRGSVLEVRYGVNWVALRPNEEKLSTNLHVATDRGRVYSFDLMEGTKKDCHRKVVVLRPDMDLDPDGGPAVPALPLPQQKSLPVLPAKKGPVTTAAGRKVTVDDLDGPAAPAAAPAATANNAKAVPGLEMIRRLDKNYSIKNGNAKVFSVDSVYNDGERTFVRFKSRLNESPLFYRVNADKKREVLTYRQESGNDPRDPDLFVIPRLFDEATVKVGDVETLITWNQVK